MIPSSRQTISPGAIHAEYTTQLSRTGKIDLVGQIISRNADVFKRPRAADRKVILNRLGWLDAIRKMPGELMRMERLVENVRSAGACHLFVLGMGGSSLGPEVFGNIFGRRPWLKSYTIIDSTAPSQLDAILKKTDLAKSFFIVSSKSGTTIETVSQFRYFFRRIKAIRPLKAGSHFAAITDPGSELMRIARRNRFRELFLNPPEIGGRYSALSFFGLVPAAFTRANLATLLRHAEQYLTYLDGHGKESDALELGVLIGCGARQGYDKLTFRASPKTAPFIPWIEQLVAESTGKELKGIIPIEGEPADMPTAASDDRLYLHYSFRRERRPAPSPMRSGARRPPLAVIELPDAHALGAEMVKWEMATAVAAIVLGVNPFDEPNVAESKKNTAVYIQESRKRHPRLAPPPLLTCGDCDIMTVSDVRGADKIGDLPPVEVFARFLAGLRRGDYLAILSYTEMAPEIEALLTRLREEIQKKTKIATLRGYGPRFLHSIGQLYKGGKPCGHFIVLEREYENDYDIPKMNLSFARLIKAQAQGDIRALQKRRRPVIVVNLKTNPVRGLNRLLDLIVQ